MWKLIIPAMCSVGDGGEKRGKQVWSKQLLIRIDPGRLKKKLRLKLRMTGLVEISKQRKWGVHSRHRSSRKKFIEVTWIWSIQAPVYNYY